MEKHYILLEKCIQVENQDYNIIIDGHPCVKVENTGNYIPQRKGSRTPIEAQGSYYRKLRGGEVVEAEIEQADDGSYYCTRIDLAPMDGVEQVRKYLSNAIHSVRTANALIDKYGDTALTAILTDEHAYDAFGVSGGTVTKIRNRLHGDMAYRTLQDLLTQRGAPCSVAPGLYNTYQDEAVNVVTNTPYRAYEESLLSFAVADRLYLATSYSATDPIRCQMAIKEVLRRAVGNGSVYWPRDMLINRTNDLVINFDCKEIDACISQMATDGALVCDGEGGADVYLPDWYEIECSVAEQIAAFERTDKRLPLICTPMDIKDYFNGYQLDNGGKLSPEQVMAVQTSLTAPASIITGDPGCGKTVVIQALVDIIRHYAPYATIRVCAPTGKSARNVADVTGLDATTIHSFVPQAERLNLDDGCHCDYLIVDEVSMVDIGLMKQLLRVMSKSCRLILVGDAGQILSIGPGLVLGQMITSGQIVIETLHQVYRQAAGSKIKELANDIKRGVLAQDYKTPDQLSILPVASDADASMAPKLAVDRLLDRGTAPQDIQILAPRRGGDVGVQAINNQVRASLNLHKTTSAAPGLQVGDRVVQTINRYNKPEGTIYNGTTGYVTAVGKDGAVTVDFGASGCFSYSKKELSDLELAYAMTIHKAQGSGFGAVVLALGVHPDPLVTRQVLYTAVTRAEKELIIIAGDGVLAQAVKNDATYNRYSKLDQRLRELLSPTRTA